MAAVILVLIILGAALVIFLAVRIRKRAKSRREGQDLHSGD